MYIKLEVVYINPIVSVIIPVYNNSLYIEQAIESVLIQDIPLEIIVINDCSQDNLEQVIEKYLKMDNFIYVKNEINLGVAASRNKGVGLAKGRFIAFLDADDWWSPDKLKKQMEIMDTNKYVICFTGRKIVNSSGLYIKTIIPSKQVVNYNTLLHHNSISCSSVMLAKKIACEHPMRNDEYHEDYINWLEVLKDHGLAFCLREPLITYRKSINGKSRRRFNSIRMTYGVYRTERISKVRSLFLVCSHLLHGIIKCFQI
ncbi:glycosyltransferase family 2 protein [Anaerocolumna sp. AGMB13020]|uniref:glycosyltransferase family 2 protein n=1 Tax=Anaerocolumna sp. AGMB13020 TaxID=3081750 RepID=UPI002952C6ED|nr:glycosyltransferase family 2 protein [Anaerocolumna sp. AGMB13020]WOO35445.1 glycosyltransferase family 2 protein [Anaerocolumna sp. AGMB13020]